MGMAFFCLIITIIKLINNDMSISSIVHCRKQMKLWPLKSLKTVKVKSCQMFVWLLPIGFIWNFAYIFCHIKFISTIAFCRYLHNFYSLYYKLAVKCCMCCAFDWIQHWFKCHITLRLVSNQICTLWLYNLLPYLRNTLNLNTCEQAEF